MHRDLKQLLHDSHGETQKVVAMFLDVRGFTSFAGLAESPDAADFLKSAYTKMIDRHFADADYFKLTGDGLMVIYGFTEAKTLQAALRDCVGKSLALVDEFPEITKDDPMINFKVPTNLGVGIARGGATVLKSGDKVLDYTGRPLNLAARLMDFARPSGVVVAGNAGVELLADETQKRFCPDAVYVDGIAEETPLEIFFLADRTLIPDHRKLPIAAPVRVTDPTETVTLSAIKERGESFNQLLTREPAKQDDIVLHYAYPKVKSDGTRHPTMRWTPTAAVSVVRKLNNWHAQINFVSIVKKMEKAGVKPDWPVQLTLEYSARTTASPT
jgi:class 3 adenylate cyclase